MTQIFTGHSLAEKLHRDIAAKIAKLGRSPQCIALYTQGDAPMAAYLARQQAMASSLGITLTPEPYATGRAALRAQLNGLAARADGAIPLFPLPDGANAAEVAAWIGPQLDLDGLHPANSGALANGAAGGIAPATARACFLVLQHLLGDLRGAEICLVGASRLIGRPLAQLLLDAEATVTICHAATRDLARHTRGADALVCAAGVAGLIGADHIRTGAVLLDVSIIRRESGLLGDVDVPAVMGKAAVVTHVPDGIGPVTTACLFNTLLDQALAASPS